MASALLCDFAFLAFGFTQRREIHGYNIPTGSIRLCSAVFKQHRPDLRVSLQDVRVQLAVIQHLKWCQRKYDTYFDVFVQRLAELVFVLSRVAFPSLDRFRRLLDRLGTLRL